MEPELFKKLEELASSANKHEAKIDAIYKSTEKTRKYILWHLIINIVVIVLPLIGLIVAIPWFLKIMTQAYSGAGL